MKDLFEDKVLEYYNSEEFSKYAERTKISKIAKVLGISVPEVKIILENNKNPNTSVECIKGVSNLYDAKGNLKLSWVKKNYEQEKLLENYKKYFQDLVAENVKPVEVIPFEGNNTLISDCCTFYPLPDLHIGMLVHGVDTNHNINYDLKTAEEWIKKSIMYLMSQTPNTETCVVTDLGDLLHSADDSNRTKSGHWLDTDGRHYKIFKTTSNIFVWMLEELLKKHKKVYFYSVPGNHSDMVGIYLKTFLQGYFKDNERISIEESHKAQQYFLFDKTLLGFSHGHQLRPQKASDVMVFDNQSIFSSTKHRYYHFGHFHSNRVITTPLCEIEVHKNLPPRDSWAEGMGFRSKIGEAKAIVYHKEYGEVSRFKFNIDMDLNEINKNPKIEVTTTKRRRKKDGQ